MSYTNGLDKPSDYFVTKLFTGNGSNGHAISGLDFQPDWVWLKNRNTGNTHEAFDSVRGATKTLYPDRSDAEYVNSTGSLTSFNSDGFTVGSGDGANKSGSGIASWNWKTGTSFTNDASSTGIGSIDSSGSFNNDAGFSIVTYTGNGSSGATVKHGMNQKPSMFIIKDRDNSNEGWMVYHTSLGATKYMRLNETGAAATGSAYFNNTEPTSSVFTIGNNDVVNKSGDKYVTYCFAEKKGYSKFGSYTGNGNADGTFVYTGFKPAFIMCKRTDGADDWFLLDNKRDIDNPANHWLMADSSGAEQTSPIFFDFTAQGFKNRGTGGGNNASGGTYIFMAFAENPFVTGSSGIPATAR